MPNPWLIKTLDSSADLIVFSLDREYRYCVFNQRHQQIMKAIWGADIALGHNMLDYISSIEDREKAKANFDRALLGEQFVLIEAYGNELLERNYYEDSYNPLFNEHNEVEGISVFVRNITDRQTSEQALIKSENRYRSLFESSLDAVALYDFSKNRFVHFNSVAPKLFGYSGEEFLEINPLFLLPEEQPDGMSSVYLYSTYLDRLNKGEKLRFEIFYQKKDGSLFESEVMLIPFFEDEILFVISVIKDLSEQKEQQRQLLEASNELRKSEALRQAILNALPDLTFRLDGRGTFLNYYSMHKSDALYAPEDALIGKTLQEIMPGPVAENCQLYVEKAIAEKKLQTHEYELLNPQNGEIQYFEARTNPFGENEVVVSIRDISATKRAEDKLSQKILELDEKNAELKKYIASNLELENFAYIASHDLKEPLRNIAGFSQLLRRRLNHQDDRDVDDYLHFIENSAKNMARLIDDVLAYSRINRDQDQSSESISTMELVQNAMNALKNRFEETNAQIQIRNLPPEIRGNYTKLLQLFQNLLDNAVKFARPGVTPKVEVSATRNGEFWAFCVRDNGMGIEKEYFDKIFLLFKRLHSKTAIEGTGVGLAICKRVVEQHGGKIYVESVVGEGSAFYFTLPA